MHNSLYNTIVLPPVKEEWHVKAYFMAYMYVGHFYNYSKNGVVFTIFCLVSISHIFGFEISHQIERNVTILHRKKVKMFIFH